MRDALPVLLAFCLAFATKAETEVEGLMVNHLRSPSDVVVPHFSWRQESDRPGARQTAWNLTVREGDEDGRTLWQSGIVEDSRSVGVAYAGPPLSSARTYVWQVSVRDELGEWSKPVSSQFVTALLEADAWKDVRFILPGEKMPRHLAAAALMRTVTNRQTLRSVHWFTTGLGVYEAYVNGVRVGDKRLKPGFTNILKARDAFGFDITEQVRTSVGESNVFAVVQTAGWWNDAIVGGTRGRRRDYARKEPAFGGVLVFRYADGREERLVTDGSWLGSWERSPVTRAGIYTGEHYDARVSLAWMKSGDASGFGPVRFSDEFKGEIRPNVGASVWHREDLSLRPVEAYVWRGVDGLTTAEAGTTNAFGKVRVVRNCPPEGPYELDAGESLVIDFGQNSAAVPEFAAQASRGTVMTIRPGELLNEHNGRMDRGCDGPEGSVYRKNLRTLVLWCEPEEEKALVSYTFGGKGLERHRATFTSFGYRYVSVTATGRVRIERFRSVPVSSVAAEQESGELVTGVPELNQFVTNVLWSQRSNYLSIPTDCPQRDERLGWMSEAANFCSAACRNAEVYAFFRKWLADVRDTQNDEGSYPGYAPLGEYQEEYGRFCYCDAGVLVPYRVWRKYGDTTILREHFTSMRRHVDFVAADRYASDRSLVYQWADWLSLDKYETWQLEWGKFRRMEFLEKEKLLQLEVRPMWKYFGGCFWLWDARMLAEMAEALGEGESADRYRAMSAEALAYLRKNFFEVDGGLLRHIRDMQTPLLYSLMLGLYEREEAKVEAKGKLVELIRARDYKVATGTIGTMVLLDALTFDADAADVAYSMVLNRDRPGWLYSVLQGGTTVWERWDGYSKERGIEHWQMNNFNHPAFGAIVDWMFSAMAGIREDPKVSGYRHFVLAPFFDRRVGPVKGTHEGPYGRIVSNWRYETDGSIRWRFTIPPNSTATVRTPDGRSAEYASGTYEIKIR